jgi:sodium-dependent dicarboxylate transporter 2/3/5
MRRRAPYAILIGIVIAVAAVFAPLSGLDFRGHLALSLLVFAVAMWSSEMLPLAVSSIIVLLIQPLLGLASFGQALSGFANPILFLLLGGFIIAEGVSASGVVNRVAFVTVAKLRGNAELVLLASVVMTGLMSAWVNNVVAFAISMPIVKLIVEMEGSAGTGTSNFARRMMLGASYGSLAGGLGTVIGTAPTLIASTYVTLPFFSWMLFGFPLAFILMLVVWRILIVVFPLEASAGKASRKKPINPGALTSSHMSHHERATLGIIVLVVVLLISRPITRIDADSVTLFGAALFLVGGILQWKSVQRNIDWGTIVFFGAALSVGNDFITSGAAGWMIGAVTRLVGNSSPLVYVVIFMILAAILTQVISNVGLTTILVPLAILLAGKMNIATTTFVIPSAVACSLSFMLPMSDPTIAMAYGTGFVSIRDIFRAGLPVTLLALCLSIPVILLALHLL